MTETPAPDTLAAKTLFGVNEERKRVTAKSMELIEYITGIPRKDMFGTKEGGEKVLYVGAPWQAKGIADESRFTYIDYEFGEIAEFKRSYSDVLPEMGTILYDQGPKRRSVSDNYEEITDNLGNDTFTPFEESWYGAVYERASRVYKDVQNLVPHFKEEAETRPEEQLLQEIKEDLAFIREQLDKRKTQVPEAITKRKQLHEEDDGASFGFGGEHPFEEFSSSLYRFVKVTDQGLRDVHDYKGIVKPALDKFEETLPDALEYEERRRLIKKEEYNYLNALRLKKSTKEAGVAVAMFPDVPFADGSFDRIVCSYSISTHVIAEMTTDDFRQWWSSFQRLLKPGGKAYIFPIQQGYPYGRTYDAQAFEKSLNEFATENGGQLMREIKENYHFKDEDEGKYLEETLILTKV